MNTLVERLGSDVNMQVKSRLCELTGRRALSRDHDCAQDGRGRERKAVANELLRQGHSHASAS